MFGIPTILEKNFRYMVNQIKSRRVSASGIHFQLYFPCFFDNNILWSISMPSLEINFQWGVKKRKKHSVNRYCITKMCKYTVLSFFKCLQKKVLTQFHWNHSFIFKKEMFCTPVLLTCGQKCGRWFVPLGQWFSRKYYPFKTFCKIDLLIP